MRPRQTSVKAWAVAFALIALLASGISATELTGPRLKCATEIFDFGYVPQDATVSHTYWLRNCGTETVNIKQIKPNCGCTRIPPTDSTITVGDSLPVEILFGTRNITGKVEKFTRIISNAEGRVPALTFRSQVFKESENPAQLVASPAIVNLAGSNESKTIIKNVSKNPVTAKVVDSPNSHIRLSFNELTLAPDESKEVAFELIPQQTDIEFTKSITLELNDPDRRRITIPVINVKKE